MSDRSERLRELIAIGSADLTADSPWIVIAAVPGESVGGPADLAGERLRAWVRQQVAVWPAPVSLGRDLPRLRVGDGDVAPAAVGPHIGTATFASMRSPVERYHCTFGADGSSVLALPVGGLRDSPADGERVLAIGEGAVAWITVAGLRLAAAFAARTGARGRALVELTIGSSGDGGAATYEVWNRDAHGFRPVGNRLATVRPVRGSVDLVACLAAGLPGTARPLVLDLLRQFGLSESRHIDAGGVLRSRNFTGYDQRILAWSRAIGVPSE